MGNCCSKEEDATTTLRNLAEHPGDEELALTSERINEGLREVARALHRNGRDITIVAVGGAVNTLYLRSRVQTADVDFFYRTKLRDENVSAVVRAAQQAARVIEVGDTWLNNHTAVFITEGLIGRLYDEAAEQNVVIFEAPGLRVLAAPWRYALATKLDRLSKGAGAREKDLSDAVAYLRQITTRLGRAVTEEELLASHREFALGTPDHDVFTRMDAAYHDQYGERGIQFQARS